ncbi:hypothetical protein T492DRAFT_1041447, partial [Pavlovales sp. CCMP2436]
MGLLLRIRPVASLSWLRRGSYGCEPGGGLLRLATAGSYSLDGGAPRAGSGGRHPRFPPRPLNPLSPFLEGSAVGARHREPAPPSGIRARTPGREAWTVGSS